MALPLAIHRQLKAFYLVHPTLKMRVTFTILGVALWGKLKFVDELTHLHEWFAPGALVVPERCVEEDQRRRASTAGRWAAPS